jgi:hypothetical protein
MNSGDLAPIELAMAKAWQIASVDLGLIVRAPETVIDREGQPLRCAVLVQDFGGIGGTACRHIDAPPDDIGRLREWAGEVGVYVSQLGERYASYDRELFISTLNDWRWFGKGDPPSWYTGVPWTS